MKNLSLSEVLDWEKIIDLKSPLLIF